MSKFSVLIYDEFYDSGNSPELMDEFDTLSSAYAYYQSVCKGGKIGMYDDLVELAMDTDDERVTLDTYSF